MDAIRTFREFERLNERSSRFWDRRSLDVLAQLEDKASDIVTSLLFIRGWELEYTGTSKFTVQRDGLAEHVAALRHDVKDFAGLADKALAKIEEGLSKRRQAVPLRTR